MSILSARPTFLTAVLFLAAILVIVPRVHADTFVFDYEVLSRTTVVLDPVQSYVQYDYLAFAVDQGPDVIYKALSYVNDVFPSGEMAYNSVDWDTLEIWTNDGDAADWLAEFQHGYIDGPVPGGMYWGDKWNAPDGADGLRPDGDSISFVDPLTYDWEGFGDDLLTYAQDPDDGYFAFSFQSVLLPGLGEWWAKDGTGYVDNGVKLVPDVAQGGPPLIPEPSTLMCLASLVLGVPILRVLKRRK